MSAATITTAARAALCLAAALACGCASIAERIVDTRLGEYFEDAGAPHGAPARFELSGLPYAQYWTGIVFNGEKIGFAHRSIGPAAGEAGRYDIRSEASFALRYLGVEKKVRLRAHDTVDAELALLRFAYDYTIDGSRMQVSGGIADGVLEATIVTGGRPTAQRLSLEGPVRPASAIALYPAIHGLAPGRDYAYRVYNGELQSVVEVTQRVTAYERSAFFEGNAYRVETQMQGQRVLTWIDEQARPAFELALHGIMISALEDEDRAKRDVALAALNKRESLIEFSILRPAEPISEPRAASAATLAVSGLRALPPSDRLQRCARDGAEAVCEVRAAGFGANAAQGIAADSRYLHPSLTVQSRDPRIVQTAQAIVAGSGSPGERVARIVRWMDRHIEKAPLDVFSALDVLETRKAECQGHAYLYAALARAAGIPTRIVSGLAYSAELEGFLYHSWAESLIEGGWTAVDPTFGQSAADAARLKLLEGETLADLAPLLDIVGRIGIRVIAVEHGPRQR